ncbi:MAG: CRISPR-associated endonuclease Cas3'', partial [Chloroflexi bacterium]|nr:CRISPR-associated endonuclease Cas3'' [Chloroflexota bacterium]
MADPWALWGKTLRPGDVGDPTHALLHHLADVAAVSEVLWDDALADSTRELITGGLGGTQADARESLAFLAGLHDLGKACPGFQMLRREALSPLRQAGFGLPRQVPGVPCYHGVVTTETLPAILQHQVGLAPQAAQVVAQALGGHHGTWPTPLELQALRRWQIGEREWAASREDITAALRQALQPPVTITWPEDTEASNTLATLLAGVSAAADWIGSMNCFFPYRASSANLPTYLMEARSRARMAVGALHWTRIALPAGKAT